MRGAILAFFFLASTLSAAPPQWVRDAAKLPAPATDRKAVVLLDERLVTVRENGEVTRTTRRVYRILTPEARDLGRAAASFGGDIKLVSLGAWQIANGIERDAPQKDAIESAAFSGELYADKKVRMISVPADVGSIVAVESAVSSTPYALQDSWLFEDELPVVVARYVLTLPPQWKHEAHWLRAKPIAPVAQGQSLVFERRDIPALPVEPGMPSFRAVASMMAIHFVPPAGAHAGRLHRSWSDVGVWYAGLVADRQSLTPPMQAKTRELTANRTNVVDKIAALAVFAQRDVRYVAIEIGIGSHRPHAASEVFSTRYGDCKDKVTVLGAMLRELGIESYYVLANTDRSSVERDFASLFSFNHAIIAIRLPDDAPKLPAMVKSRAGNVLLFDPTSETTPFGHLPAYLQENRVLLVTRDGGELLDVAPHAPETNRLERRAKLAVDETGKLAGSVHETRSGSIAARHRAYLQSLDGAGRTKFVENLVTSHLSRAAVRDVVFENLENPAADLIVRYAIEVPSYARKAGGMLLVRPRVIGRKADALFEQKERRHPYETTGTSLEIDEVEIAVPAAARAEELPKALDIDTPTARYKSEAKFEAGVLKYRRRYELRQVLVPAAAIAELNKTFAQILADERATALLK